MTNAISSTPAENTAFECEHAHLMHAFKAARLSGDTKLIHIHLSSKEMWVSVVKKSARSRSSLPISWSSPAPDEELEFATEREIFEILGVVSTKTIRFELLEPNPTVHRTKWVLRISFDKTQIEWLLDRVTHQDWHTQRSQDVEIRVAPLRETLRLVESFAQVDRTGLTTSYIEIGERRAAVLSRRRTRAVHHVSLDTPAFRCEPGQIKDLLSALAQYGETKCGKADSYVSFSDGASVCIIESCNELKPSTENVLDVRARTYLQRSELEEAVWKIVSQTTDQEAPVQVQLIFESDWRLKLTIEVRGGNAIVTLPIRRHEGDQLQEVGVTLQRSDLEKLVAMDRVDLIRLGFGENFIEAFQELDGVSTRTGLAAKERSAPLNRRGIGRA